MEELPEGAAVTPELWSAALAANPLDFPGEKYPRNLQKREMYLRHVLLCGLNPPLSVAAQFDPTWN